MHCLGCRLGAIEAENRQTLKQTLVLIRDYRVPIALLMYGPEFKGFEVEKIKSVLSQS